MCSLCVFELSGQQQAGLEEKENDNKLSSVVQH